MNDKLSSSVSPSIYVLIMSFCLYGNRMNVVSFQVYCFYIYASENECSFVIVERSGIRIVVAVFYTLYYYKTDYDCLRQFVLVVLL